jgi:GxxExxY protein
MIPFAGFWLGGGPQIAQISQMESDRARIRDPESHAVIGAAIRVHQELGHGFLEGVYQEALELELKRCGVPFICQVVFPLHYRGTPLRSTYRADLVCYGSMIVELKALRHTGPSDEAQVINYLKASKLTKALLLNFGAPSLGYRRLVLCHIQSASSA